MTKRPASVLDASALLAYLFAEPGVQAVSELLQNTCAISAANYAEVLSKVSDHGQDASRAAGLMARRGLTGGALLVEPLDEAQAVEIARLRRETKKAGLSLGDRACLALGRALKLPVVTADRRWSELGLKDEIFTIR